VNAQIRPDMHELEAALSAAVAAAALDPRSRPRTLRTAQDDNSVSLSTTLIVETLASSYAPIPGITPPG
jgi:hypothetical protein